MSSMWLSDAQKVGVAFCSGGGFFFCAGIVMFFDRAMLAMGNILFLVGLTLIIGLQKTAVFFARRQKWKGTAAFVGGISLILLRWPLVGFCVELYGIIVLFGDFFSTIGGFAGNIPVVGPYIREALNRAGGGRRNAELPTAPPQAQYSRPRKWSVGQPASAEEDEEDKVEEHPEQPLR